MRFHKKGDRTSNKNVITVKKFYKEIVRILVGFYF